jgi:metal-sulfur cluster biosynthetic enzyme
VNVTMTLTSMGCPAGPEITTDIDGVLRLEPNVKDVAIEVVWDPPWTPDRIKPEIRAMLFGPA